MSPDKKSPIQQLKDLPPLGFPMPYKRDLNGWVEYSEDGRSNRARGLMSEAGISIAQWFNSKDYIFPEHSHAQEEWLIVYKGSLHVSFFGEDNKEKYSLDVNIGESVHIPPNTKHSLVFPEDCWYIDIAIPQSFDWPN